VFSFSTTDTALPDTTTPFFVSTATSAESGSVLSGTSLLEAGAEQPVKLATIKQKHRRNTKTLLLFIFLPP
jgi:hypothetical protein